MRGKTMILATAMPVLATPGSWAQLPDNSALKSEQAEKMRSLAWLDGEWRGEATIAMPGGDLMIIQTERIGPMLDGGAKVIEGRGYTFDGKLAFNALGVVTYDAYAKKYEIHSLNDGRTCIFPLQVTNEGYNWQTPAGPNSTIQYVVKFRDGLWIETGSLVTKNAPAKQFIEMRLKRVASTKWPLGSPLGPKK